MISLCPAAWKVHGIFSSNSSDWDTGITVIPMALHLQVDKVNSLSNGPGN